MGIPGIPKNVKTLVWSLVVMGPYINYNYFSLCNWHIDGPIVQDAHNFVMFVSVFFGSI